MPTDCIDYRELPQFSELIRDYLDQKASVQPLYHRFPSLSHFEAQCQEKAAHYSTAQREGLVTEWRRQYKGFKLSEASEAHLNALHEPTTFTITTGHQLNLFTGPVFFWYKIISVINLCKSLQKTYPHYRFVPVYWMATEDHDFEEIQSFRWGDEKITWNSTQQGAVGRFVLDASFEEVRNRINTSFPEGERGQFLKTLFHTSYAKGRTLAEATRYLVHQLFDQEGLLIFDGDQTWGKTAFLPFALREIQEQITHQATQETREQMSSYKAQVNPRELNLFYLEKGIRERLTREGDWIVRHDSGIRYALDDFKRHCQEQPDCLSPNVLLRPLYQEIVLPNLAYIGGGGEIAYWLQLKKQFQQFEVPFPMLILRNSVLHATAKQAKKAAKLDVAFADLFLSASDLRTRMVQKIQTVHYDFTAQKNLLQEQFAALEKLAVQTDPSFLGAVKAQTHKQLKGLEHLEKKLLRAEKKKHEVHLNAVEALQLELFPHRGLQERTVNFSSFYLSFGPEWMTRLYAELNPLHPYFSVMVWD